MDIGVHRVEQLGGGLTNLPIPVSGGDGSQRGLDPGVVEAGQSHGRPAPDGRLVVQRLQDGVEPGRVADGTQGGHRALAATWIVVVARRRDQPGYGGAMAALAQAPRRAHDDERVGVGQGLRDGSRERRARTAAPDRRCGLDRTSAHGVVAEAERHDHVVRREQAETVQRPERGHVHPGVGVFQATAGDGGVIIPVPRQDDAATAFHGAAVGARIRGRIVAHRLRVCPTSTKLPAGTPRSPSTPTSPVR